MIRNSSFKAAAIVFSLGASLGSLNAADLVAHYTFDETTGATAADSATLGAQASTPGTITDTVTLGQPGVIGTSFEFTGAGFIELQADGSTASDVNPDGPFTLTVWAQPNSGTIGNTALFSTQAIINNAGLGMVLKTQNGGWRIFFDTADADIATGVTIYTADQWDFIWVRYDGSTLQLGVVPLGGSTIAAGGVNQTAENTNVGGTVDLTPAPTTIGGLDSVQTNRSFTGHLDDLRLYNAALTDQEIADVYNLAITPSGIADWRLQ